MFRGFIAGFKRFRIGGKGFRLDFICFRTGVRGLRGFRGFRQGFRGFGTGFRDFRLDSNGSKRVSEVLIWVSEDSQ